MNELRRKIIDSYSDNDTFEMNKKKAIKLVKSKIEPEEKKLVKGLISLDDFLKRIEPCQKQINGLVGALPVLSNTFRYARKGELFATNTIMKRINNAENPKFRKSFPDE